MQVPLQVPWHSPLALPSAVLPSQVPSHLPAHFTPPVALQEPLHSALQEPVHSSATSAFAVHSPLQATSSLPPVHVGGFALISHLPETSHLAWQLAFALIDASHFGGTKTTESLPDADALTVPIAATAASQYAFIFACLSGFASAASSVAFGASRSDAMFLQAVVMSSIAALAMPWKSATAWTATWL